jgi:hypothetical protein
MKRFKLLFTRPMVACAFAIIGTGAVGQRVFADGECAPGYDLSIG